MEKKESQKGTHDHRKALGDDGRALGHGCLEQLVKVAGDAVRARETLKRVLDDRDLLRQLADEPVVVVELGRGEKAQQNLGREEIRV